MTDAAITIREAREHEAGVLTDLALASKAHWGYPPEFMQACRAELTVAPGDVRDGSVVVAQDGDDIVGFYALAPIDRRAVELDALFVAPQHMARGIGRILIEHAAHAARSRGVSRLVIQGDPHAAAFYRKVGAVLVGERESASVPGRQLPLLELDLSTIPHSAGG